jgi:hypothetical protein
MYACSTDGELIGVVAVGLEACAETHVVDPELGVELIVGAGAIAGRRVGRVAGLEVEQVVDAELGARGACETERHDERGDRDGVEP